MQAIKYKLHIIHTNGVAKEVLAKTARDTRKLRIMCGKNLHHCWYIYNYGKLYKSRTLLKSKQERQNIWKVNKSYSEKLTTGTTKHMLL